MPNPLVKIAMTGASMLAAGIAQKAMTRGWNSLVGNEPPTDKQVKQSAKETAQIRKQAKKDGYTKEEIKAIEDPEVARPVWQVALWAILSGVILQVIRQAAASGTEVTAKRLFARRPRANRG